MPHRKHVLSAPVLKPTQKLETLVCKITLGPLTIDTEASLDAVSALILSLVREYRELPAK